MVLRAIKPFILIRFGYFYSDRIGHFAFDLEHYLCEVRQKNKIPRTVDYFFLFGNPCNSALVTMASRKIKMVDGLRVFVQASKSIPFSDSHIIRPAKEINGSRDIKQLFQSTSRSLEFSSSEMAAGKEYLQEIGLGNGDQFVCLLVRDGTYLSKMFDRDFSYHNYRDSDIKTYAKGAKSLAEKGYWVFRMGKIVEEEFDCDNHRIVDYANSKFQSDFLDIWLTAQCKFSISTSTGLDAISEVFRVPMVFVNHLPVGNLKTGDTRHIELFKILRWKENKRRLRLSEQISTGAINCYSAQEYQDNGIEIEDNNEDEILDAILEMEARLTGTWIEQPGDENLQRTFFSILKNWEEFKNYHGPARSRISTKFLRENRDWFLS